MREPPARAFSVIAWGPRPGWVLTIGPPGCGKTQAVALRVRAWLEAGVPSDSIVCLSFSRAARKELAARVASVCHGLLSEPLAVRTIHSVSFELRHMTTDRIMGAKRWQEFAAAHGYDLTDVKRGEQGDDLEWRAPPRGTADDQLRHAYDWGRSLGLTPAQSVARYAGGALSLTEFEAFVRRYEAFKRRHDLRDFIDLLQDVLDGELRPDASVFAIDEAQELSPLLLRVLHLWIGDSEDVQFAGDDDQSIHSFHGGDARWLVELSQICRVESLTQSHRVPLRPYLLAQAIIRPNKQRIAKEYHPARSEGEVLRLPLASVYPLLDGSCRTFVLARNRVFLQAIALELIERVVPFVVEGGGAPSPLSIPGIRDAACTAIAIYRRDGEQFAAVSIQRLLTFAPAFRSSLSRTTRTRLVAAAERHGVIPMRQLADVYGFAPLFERIATDGPLSCFERLSDSTRRYLSALYARYGELPEPLVTLTSIHGAKGREAELVVVLPDMSAASYRQYRGKDHEEENRIFYVAVTRAKHTLVLVEPQGRKYFEFPKPVSVAAGDVEAHVPDGSRGGADA